jgi:hypothetical protein
MHHFVAAAFAILIVTGPAAAVDLGVGLQAGDVGLSTNSDAGRKGASVGSGASLGNLGGVNTGASVGSNGSVSSAAAGASSAAGTAAASAGDTMGPSTTASSPKGKAGVATAASVAPAEGVQYSIALPWNLRPSRGSGRSAMTALNDVPGTPSAVVSACRAAIEAAASPFGMLSVQARSAGSLRLLSDGNVSAPIRVRIEYARLGGAEIRQARVRCHLDAKGRVINLT